MDHPNKVHNKGFEFAALPIFFSTQYVMELDESASAEQTWFRWVLQGVQALECSASLTELSDEPGGYASILVEHSCGVSSFGSIGECTLYTERSTFPLYLHVSFKHREILISSSPRTEGLHSTLIRPATCCMNNFALTTRGNRNPSRSNNVAFFSQYDSLSVLKAFWKRQIMKQELIMLCNPGQTKRFRHGKFILL